MNTMVLFWLVSRGITGITRCALVWEPRLRFWATHHFSVSSSSALGVCFLPSATFFAAMRNDHPTLDRNLSRAANRVGVCGTTCDGLQNTGNIRGRTDTTGGHLGLFSRSCAIPKLSLLARDLCRNRGYSAGNSCKTTEESKPRTIFDLLLVSCGWGKYMPSSKSKGKYIPNAQQQNN